MIDAGGVEHADGGRRLVRGINDFCGCHNSPDAVAPTGDEDAAIGQPSCSVSRTRNGKWTKLFDLART